MLLPVTDDETRLPILSPWQQLDQVSPLRQGPIPTSSSRCCVFLYHKMTLKNLLKNLLSSQNGLEITAL